MTQRFLLRIIIVFTVIILSARILSLGIGVATGYVLWMVYAVLIPVFVILLVAFLIRKYYGLLKKRSGTIS